MNTLQKVVLIVTCILLAIVIGLFIWAGVKDMSVVELVKSWFETTKEVAPEVEAPARMLLKI